MRVELKYLPSDNSGEETPVPIPNTEVKLSSADGSWGQRPCESRSSLGNVKRSMPLNRRHASFFAVFIRIFLYYLKESYVSFSKKKDII